MTGLSQSERLGRVADRLSEREQQLVRDVALRRLLSGAQLRRLFFADYTHVATATRRTQATLARLVGLGLLARLDRRVGGVRAGSSGYVYEATPEGQRLVDLIWSDERPTKRHRRSLEPGRSFVAHTLAVAELFVRLVEAERAERLTLVAEQPEPACWRNFVGPLGAADTLRPDAFVVTERDGVQQWSFVEVDRGTEGSAALLRKCEVYRRYWQTGAEQATYGRFPTVVWLVDRSSRIEVLDRVIRELPDAAALFRVGLFDDALDLLTPASQGGTR